MGIKDLFGGKPCNIEDVPSIDDMERLIFIDADADADKVEEGIFNDTGTEMPDDDMHSDDYDSIEDVSGYEEGNL